MHPHPRFEPLFVVLTANRREQTSIAQNDKVVSLLYAEATVRDTGRAFVSHEAHVWTFRDRKLVRFQIYLDTAAAAAAHRAE
jgi:ketosteroid isomerase-like protein